MKVNYNTLRRRVDNVDLLTIKDIRVMAKLFDVEEALLFQLISNDFGKNSASKRLK
jgi:hypothetical protein